MTLARLRWDLGQVLLPGHFTALEESLATESAARQRLLGLPAHGVARLDWNGDDLGDGVLFVHGLTAVLPSGELVDVPGNAHIAAPLDLDKAGRPAVEAYLHLLPPPHVREAALDPAASAGAPPLPRALRSLVLTSEPALSGGVGRIKLAELERPLGGKWRVKPSYVPPLLQVGSTPYLSGRLAALSAELDAFDKVLADMAIDAVTRGEPLRTLQRARVEVRRLLARLADLDRGIHPHPYWVHRWIWDFALELHLLDDAVPFEALPAYDHEAFVPAVDALLALVAARMHRPPARAPHVPFAIDDGRFVASGIPAGAFDAQDVYVVVQGTAPFERTPLDPVRFASPTRLRSVHEHALRGVRFARVVAPSFRHAFGPGVEFYQLKPAELSGDDPEWDHVVRERAISFYRQPRLEGIRAAVHWRPR